MAKHDGGWRGGGRTRGRRHWPAASMGRCDSGAARVIPRLFVTDLVRPGTTLVVRAEHGHHYARVLRVRQGESITVVAPTGRFDCVVAAVDEKGGSLTLAVRSEAAARDALLTTYLLQGLPKGDKMDEIITRATEIGVTGVVAYQARRTLQWNAQTQGKRLQRWRRLAEQAAAQAQRDRIPLVDTLSTSAAVSAWLRAIAPDAVLLLDECDSGCGLRTAIRRRLATQRRDAVWVIAVGPEGGWDEEERLTAQTQWCAERVTMGGRILRTETAGIAALAALLCESGDLGW